MSAAFASILASWRKNTSKLSRKSRKTISRQETFASRAACTTAARRTRPCRTPGAANSAQYCASDGWCGGNRLVRNMRAEGSHGARSVPRLHHSQVLMALQECPSEDPRDGWQTYYTGEVPCAGMPCTGMPSEDCTATNTTRSATDWVAASEAELAGDGTTPSTGRVVGTRDGKTQHRTESLGEAQRRDSCPEPFE